MRRHGPGELAEIAFALHDGQQYRLSSGPVPYRRHLESVASRLIQHDRWEVFVAAAFHDAVEDGRITESALRLIAGDEVADIVMAVTRRRGDETYAEYIQRVKKGPPGSVEVKLADLRSNLAACPTDSQRRRYEAALTVLTDGAAGQG